MHRQAEVFKALKCKAFPPMCMHAHLCISFCCLAARLKTQELAHRMLSEMQKWQRAEGNIHCPENNGSILENGHFPPTRQMQAFFFLPPLFWILPSLVIFTDQRWQLEANRVKSDLYCQTLFRPPVFC